MQTSLRQTYAPLAFAFALLTGAALGAQEGNYALDGDNALALTHPDFPARLTWHLASQNVGGGSFPASTYWFVRPDDAHAIVALADGDNTLFIELSGTKQLYTFPADYSQTIGRVSLVRLELTDKTGQNRELTPDPTRHLTVRVDERDALHLKLTIDGAVSTGGRPAAAVAVKGTISISKKSPDLEHLPDGYAGCDNTIFNRESPIDDLNQWRTTTGCENSLHHKTWAAIDAALQPVYSYLRTQTWLCGGIAEKKRDNVYRGHDGEPFTLARFAHERLTGSCTPNAAALAKSIPLDRITELAQKLAALPIDPPPADRDRVNKERDAIQKELTDIGNGVTGKQQLLLEITVNEAPTQYPIEIGSGSIQKTGSGEYVIADTAPKGGYNDSGGTYVLLGRWKAPIQSGGTVAIEPDLSSTAKPLTVQAVMIRLGTGGDLARQLLQRLDVSGLLKALPIVP